MTKDNKTKKAISAMTPETSYTEVTTESQALELTQEKGNDFLKVPYPDPIYNYLDVESIEVLNSHQYVKHKTKFAPVMEWIEPIFNDIMLSDLNEVKLTIRGTKPVEVGKDNELLTSYGRVSLVYEITDNEEFHMSIGFILAFDIATPVIRVFSGVKVTACTNLCIFGAADVQNYSTENEAGAHLMFAEYIENARKKYQEYKEIINFMKSNCIEYKDLHRFYGSILLKFAAVKNIAGTNVISNSAELIHDPKGKYYVSPESYCTLWNLFNSLTDDYSTLMGKEKRVMKTDLLDQPKKVLSLFRECDSFVKRNPDFIKLTSLLN